MYPSFRGHPHIKTETPTSARLSLETGVTIAALLFIALILMRPWLPL